MHSELPAMFGMYLMQMKMGHDPDSCRPQGFQFLNALKTARMQTPELVAGWQVTTLEKEIPNAFKLPSYARLEPAPWTGVLIDGAKWHRQRGSSHLVYTNRWSMHQSIQTSVEITAEQTHFRYRVR